MSTLLDVAKDEIYKTAEAAMAEIASLRADIEELRSQLRLAERCEANETMRAETALEERDRLAAELSAARAALAWELYCSETAGDMDVRDCWEQLPASAQTRYLRMAASRATPSARCALDELHQMDHEDNKGA